MASSDLRQSIQLIFCMQLSSPPCIHMPHVTQPPWTEDQQFSPPVMSSFLGLNILFSTVFQRHPQICRCERKRNFYLPVKFCKLMATVFLVQNWDKPAPPALTISNSACCIYVLCVRAVFRLCFEAGTEFLNIYLFTRASALKAQLTNRGKHLLFVFLAINILCLYYGVNVLSKHCLICRFIWTKLIPVWTETDDKLVDTCSEYYLQAFNVRRKLTSCWQHVTTYSRSLGWLWFPSPKFTLF
jgi:hypothetical protein